MKSEQIKDRRQKPRYRVQGMVIAVTRPFLIPPASIEEISQSGLVFHYRQSENRRMAPKKLNIVWADYVATHFVEKIPIRIVSDVLTAKKADSNPFSNHRLAVAFENLTARQERQLLRLIRARGIHSP